MDYPELKDICIVLIVVSARAVTVMVSRGIEHTMHSTTVVLDEAKVLLGFLISMNKVSLHCPIVPCDCICIHLSLHISKT